MINLHFPTQNFSLFFKFQISNFLHCTKCWGAVSGWSVFRATGAEISRWADAGPCSHQKLFFFSEMHQQQKKNKNLRCRWQQWENMSVRRLASSAGGVLDGMFFPRVIFKSSVVLFVLGGGSQTVWLQAAKLFGDQCLLTHEPRISRWMTPSAALWGEKPSARAAEVDVSFWFRMDSCSYWAAEPPCRRASSPSNIYKPRRFISEIYGTFTCLICSFIIHSMACLLSFFLNLFSF